jgi:predicted nucleic acid-binding protein
MKRVVISDTSCLIVLSKINCLHILQNLFGEVLITEEIENEFGERLPSWIIVKRAKSRQIEKILELNVDEGEASAMALYLEQPTDALLVIDERKGRIVAKDLGIKIIGTIGVILKAKEYGVISNLSEIVERLEVTDFRISPKLKQQLIDVENLTVD